MEFASAGGFAEDEEGVAVVVVSAVALLDDADGFGVEVVEDAERVEEVVVFGGPVVEVVAVGVATAVTAGTSP